MPKMITNMAAGNISIALGARGKCTNVVTACATGTHCIGDAFRTIQYGDADICLAGGTEGAICPTGVARIYEPHGFEHEPGSPSRFDSL